MTNGRRAVLASVAVLAGCAALCGCGQKKRAPLPGSQVVRGQPLQPASPLLQQRMRQGPGAMAGGGPQAPASPMIQQRMQPDASLIPPSQRGRLGR